MLVFSLHPDVATVFGTVAPDANVTLGTATPDCTLRYNSPILFTPNLILRSSTDTLDASLHFGTKTSDDTLHSTADTPDAFPLSATNTTSRCYSMLK
jgi:hypothetical protein